ncbi:unnamed protein product, partial [Dovyalis caffra]
FDITLAQPFDSNNESSTNHAALVPAKLSAFLIPLIEESHFCSTLNANLKGNIIAPSALCSAYRSVHFPHKICTFSISSDLFKSFAEHLVVYAR